MIILKILGLAISAACCYRLGGIGGGKWYFNTKVRDIGVTICILIMLYICKATFPWYIWLVTALLSFGSLTTYCTPKGQQDVLLFNWVTVGVMYSCVMLPIAFYTGHWLGFGVRALILTIGIPLISEKFDNVWLEEGGRGFLLSIVTPLTVMG